MSASASTAMSAVASTSAPSNDRKRKLTFSHEQVKQLSLFRSSSPIQARLVDRAQKYQVTVRTHPSQFSDNPQRTSDDLAETFLTWVREHEQSDAELSVTNTCATGPDDACPPFDFVWTDSYILSSEVPPSDDSQLEGCDCDQDSCDPATCKCIDRALKMDLFDDYKNRQFAYNENKTLHSSGLGAIWECNKKCQCSNKCANRVVQHGRQYGIDFFKTPECGWGVRAREKIPLGAFIGVYGGELITNTESDRRDAVYEKMGTTYVFDLDAEVGRLDCIRQEVRKKLAEQGELDQYDNDQIRAQTNRVVDLVKLANKHHDELQLRENDVKKAKEKGIWTEEWESERNKKHEEWEKQQQKTDNTFLSLNKEDQEDALVWERWDEDRIKNSQLSVDGGLCGNFTRYLNHSCQGNLFVTLVYINEASPLRPFLAFFAAREVLPGEELTFDYINFFGATETPANEEPTTDQEAKEHEEEEGTRAMRCRCGAPKCRKWVWRKK